MSGSITDVIEIPQYCLLKLTQNNTKVQRSSDEFLVARSKFGLEMKVERKEKIHGHGHKCVLYRHVCMGVDDEEQMRQPFKN